jgi:pimeloyl-ACP methyl ester carboxylesterase
LSTQDTIALPVYKPGAQLPVFLVGGDDDTTVDVDQMLAEYLALPAERRFLHISHGVGHSPNVQVASQFAELLDRFVTHTVPQVTAVH